MASENSPGWLPPGWTMHVKEILGRKVKFYLNLEGRKFYTKPQVHRYLKTISNGAANEETHNADGLTGDISQGNDTGPRTLGGDRKCKDNGDLRRQKSASESDMSQINGRPEWLPHGWFVEMRVKGNGRRYKCYVDPQSGRKFYSKPGVSRYLKAVNSSKASDHKDIDCLTGDGSSSEPDSSKEDKVSEWLPDGWIVEVRARERGQRRGMKEKFFTDPVSGRKFFSKQQVLNHLAKKESCGAGKREVKEDKAFSEVDMSLNSEAIDVGHNISEKKEVTVPKFTNDNKVISRTPAEGLPPGWTKELRIRKRSCVADPYYVDPLNGYSFRSKRDALRYADSGNIEKCAIRPTKRDINEEASGQVYKMRYDPHVYPTDAYV